MSTYGGAYVPYHLYILQHSKNREIQYSNVLVPYHVAIRTDVVLVDPEDRAAPLRAHTGVCQPACPRILFYSLDLI